MTPPAFCSPFDATLAESGTAAVFLLDPEGMLRFDAEWTRDAWGRSPGPHEHVWRWVLVRDRDTSFVQLVLCTSPTLLAAHPRGQVRLYETYGDAVAARSEFGRPPLSAPW